MHALLSALRKELSKKGNGARARGAQAYMKTSERFHGVDAATLRAVCRRVFADRPLRSAAEWQRDVLAIWRGATFREERYAAIELAGDPRAKTFQTMDALPMYEEMIMTGAWWDLVDVLATKRLGEILAREPEKMGRAMRVWGRSGSLWKRRGAILCQNRFKEKTDLRLLYACIEPSLDSKEFFLRKGIGWALRQLAWWNPREALRYVKENELRLSGLSKREALINVSGRRASTRRKAPAR